MNRVAQYLTSEEVKKIPVCKPALGLVYCGVCGRKIRRLGERMGESEHSEHPLIHTRTLVNGLFVPSCSVECAGVMRAQIGDGYGRGRR